MPKPPSSKLFHLIQNLSSAERRYFKVFVGKTATPTHSKYLRLFEAVEKMETFDDEACRKAVYEDASLESRKYSELKSYLYDLILTSLQHYDEKTSIDFQLKNMLKNVRVLSKRAFYADCKEILAKAKKIAYQYEQFQTILEVTKWEKKIAYAESDIVFLDNFLEKIKEEEKFCLSKIKEELDYWEIYFQLLILSKKEATLRSDEKKLELKKLLDQPPISAQKENLPSHLSSILHHRILGYYHFSMGDYGSFYGENQALMQLMEGQKPHLSEDPSHYISVINNQIICCGMLHRYEEVDFLLEKLKTVPAISFDDKFKIFTQYYLNKLVLCAESGKFQEGLVVIEEREKQKNQFKKKIFEANFFFLYAYIFFGVRQYEKALEWLNRLLDMPKTIVRQDLQSVARIFNLILHYEMGNVFLLESLLRSTYRYLHKQDRYYGFESRFLRFINKSRSLATKEDLYQEFEKLKEDLEEIAKEEQIIFRYFHFLAWLESKLNNKDFATVVQSLYAKKMEQR